MFTSQKEKVITNDMLMKQRDRLLSGSRKYALYQIWKSYKILDEHSGVEILNGKANINPCQT